jgi:hypothetical protein
MVAVTVVSPSSLPRISASEGTTCTSTTLALHDCASTRAERIARSVLGEKSTPTMIFERATGSSYGEGACVSQRGAAWVHMVERK